MTIKLGTGTLEWAKRKRIELHSIGYVGIIKPVKVLPYHNSLYKLLARKDKRFHREFSQTELIKVLAD